MPAFREVGSAIDNSCHGHDATIISRELGVIAVFDGISTKQWEAQQTADRFAEILVETGDVRKSLKKLIYEGCHETTATIVQLQTRSQVQSLTVGDSPLLLANQDQVRQVNRCDTLYEHLFSPLLEVRLQDKEPLEVTFRELRKAIAFTEQTEVFQERIRRAVLKDSLGQGQLSLYEIKALNLIFEHYLGFPTEELHEEISRVREEVKTYGCSPSLITHIALRSRDVLTRCLSHEQLQKEPLEPEVHDLGEAEILILCSDGVTKNLFRHEIGRLLQRHDNLQEAADELIHKAKKRGFIDDDMSVILAR